MTSAYIEQFVTLPADSQESNQALNAVIDSMPGSSVLDLVEVLEPQLTSAEPHRRAKSLQLIRSFIVSRPESLQPLDTLPLCKFLCSRLKDQPSVADALDCLVLLVSYDSLVDGSEVVELILTTVFSELSVQTYLQSTRYLVFHLFSIIVNKFIDCVQEMQHDFTVGFITSMDGEKDPRNLILCFRLVQVVVAKFDFADYAEEIFEICACYFPITFRPPADDPYSITVEDLKSDLHKCLIGSHLFAEYAMPLFIEKFESNSEAAVHDSAECMMHAVPVFGLHHYVPHLKKLIDATFKHLSVHSTTASLTSVVSRFLAEVVGRLNKDPTFEVQLLPDFYQEVASKCTEMYSELESKNVHLYFNLMTELASRSLYAWTQTFNETIPDLLEKYLTVYTGSMVAKRVILDFFAQMLKIISRGAEYDESLLKSWSNHMVSLFIENLKKDGMTMAIRSVSLNGMMHAMQIKDMLSIFELQEFIDALMFAYKKSYDGVEVMGAFKQISIIHTDFVFTEVVSKFVNDPDHFDIEIIKNICGGDEINAMTVDLLCKVMANGESALHSRDDLYQLFYTCLMTWKNYNAPLDCVLEVVAGKIKDGTASGAVIQLFAQLYRIMDADMQKSFFEDSFCADNFLNILVIYARPQTLLGNDFLSDADINSENLGVLLCASVNKVRNNVETIMNQMIKNVNVYRQCELIAWIIKGLVMRGDKVGFDLLEQFISKLSDAESSAAAAKAFPVIFKDDGRQQLTKDNHFAIALLYKQRLFSLAIPLLCQAFKSAPAGRSSDILHCFSKILGSTPKQIILSELENILPLLFSSMEYTETLDALCVILTEAPEHLSSHVPSLIGKLLDLLQQPALSIYTRVNILKCLTELAKMPIDVIYPFQKRVTNGLIKSIADHKRVVRKKAVSCRNVWFLIK